MLETLIKKLHDDAPPLPIAAKISDSLYLTIK